MSPFSLPPWNRRSNGMRDYRFSSIAVPTFLPCFSGGLLAVARSGSDIEMSKPLSQITKAEDAFSSRLTVQRSPAMQTIIWKRLPKSVRSQASLSSWDFLWNAYGRLISDRMHQKLHYLAGHMHMIYFLPGCWKRKYGHFGPVSIFLEGQCVWKVQGTVWHFGKCAFLLSCWVRLTLTPVW